MKKLLPLILLFIGAGAGVGAGIFLRPEASTVETPQSDEKPAKESADDDAHKDDAHKDAKKKDHGDDHSDDRDEKGGLEYAKLSNQFVVPIVSGDQITALVVLALSMEVPEGQLETVFRREPKLRDSFLQVLFDHANIGGFEGNFTDALVLRRLRDALREVAQKDLGKEVAKDVLIVEIARQDY